MKSIAYNGSGFVEIEKKTPTPVEHDLLVEIKAIAINPIDTKVKHGVKAGDDPKVFGFDASGKVIAVGENVTLFNVGDEVYYAGDVTRDGSYASHQLVDERIVGKKPKSLSFKESAALALTTITAWESLFDRLKITEKDKDKTLLLVGASGGVGSIAIQLAKEKIGLKVVVTASRDESKQWCKQMGADFVLDHHNLVRQFQDNNLTNPDFILCMGHPDEYFAELAEVLAISGSICLLASAGKEHDINLLKTKSATLVWEFMFTRPMYKTPDMIEQHNLLNETSSMIDDGKIKTTITQELSPINIENISKSHDIVEQGKMLGKFVIYN